MSKVIIAIIVIILIVLTVGVFAFVYLSQNQGSQGDQNNQNTSSHPLGSSFMVQGMKVEITKEGTGNQTKTGNTLTVRYENSLPDGTIIDSSYDRHRVYSFKVGNSEVIKGWDLGLLEMKIGEKRKMTIPPALAYGADGLHIVSLPPNTNLISKVELMNIK